MANNRKLQQKTSKDEPEFRFPDLEQEAKYELELTWCVQKLTLGIANEKDPKKVNDAVKSLNSLKNKNVSVIKKRQIMHNLFGDYRKKMKNDEKANVNKFFFQNKTINNESKFVRKSNKNTLQSDSKLSAEADIKKTAEDNKTKQCLRMSAENTCFKFNFNFNDENK